MKAAALLNKLESAADIEAAGRVGSVVGGLGGLTAYLVGLPYYLFNKMDTNDDNVISQQEWTAAHPGHMFSPKLDTSGDHVLSFKEFLFGTDIHPDL